jgi:hypothetical protein
VRLAYQDACVHSLGDNHDGTGTQNDKGKQKHGNREHCETSNLSAAWTVQLAADRRKPLLLPGPF